jgi:hypothetical protein
VGPRVDVKGFEEENVLPLPGIELKFLYRVYCGEFILIVNCLDKANAIYLFD